MQTFRYRGLDAYGEAVAGTVNADSPRTATDYLSAQDIEVTSIRPSRQGLRARGSNAFELVAFCEQLAGLTKTGAPLPEVLRSLSREAGNPAFSRSLERIAQGVENGRALDELLHEEERVFPSIIPNLIRAGQESGRLPEVLRLTATFLWRSEAIASQIRSALAYPIMVAALTLCICVPVVFFIIPMFADLFKEMIVFGGLPPQTRVALAVAEHPFAFSGIVLGILFVIGLFVFHGERLATCVSLRQYLLLRIPLLGSALRCAFLARFTALMALLLRAGLPLERALLLAGELDPSTIPPVTLEQMNQVLQRGGGLAGAMRTHRTVFPELLIWMVDAAHGSDRLAETFEEASVLYEHTAEREIVVLASLIQPTFFVLIGLVLAFLVMALLGPLYQLIFFWM